MPVLYLLYLWDNWKDILQITLIFEGFIKDKVRGILAFILDLNELIF